MKGGLVEGGKKVPRTDWLADLARGHSFPLREARVWYTGVC